MSEFQRVWRYGRNGEAVLCETEQDKTRCEEKGYKDTPDTKAWELPVVIIEPTAEEPEAITKTVAADVVISANVDIEDVPPQPVENYVQYVQKQTDKDTQYKNRRRR